MQQNQLDIPKRFDNNSDSLNIRMELEKYLIYWKWFLLSAFVALGLAFIYLRYTTPNYSANTLILIKDNKKAGLSAELEAFKDLGIVGGSSVNNTDNEIEILKSRRIIGKVVDTLNLDIYYYASGRVIETEAYKASPVKIEFVKKDSLLFKKDTVFNVRLIDNFRYELKGIQDELISAHSFGETVEGEIGTFKVIRNKSIKSESNVVVKIYPRYRIIDSYRSRIGISPVNKNSSVLKITLSDPVRSKAEDILNELVRQYNIDAINDKNQVSKKTKKFIDARLKKVSSDLILIDNNVQKFKTDQNFTGLPVEAELAFKSLKESNQNIANLQIQISLAEWVEDILKKESSKESLLPSGLSFDDESLVSAINNYNDLILNKNKATKNAGAKNPVLQQLDYEIKSLRLNLLKSLSNTTRSLKIQLNEIENNGLQILSKVKSIPANERGYIDIVRQQEIFAGLYSYLLKKKEEIDISLAVTVPNAKIIDVAYSSGGPISPKRKIIYFIALLLGLLLPFSIIYLLNLFDTKIHTKQNIEEQLSVPFLGDVPKSDSKEKVIIGNDVRSSAAEAFRLIRTNLDFMLASNRKQSKSIFVTSTTSGEGKSFISINLAATLALSGKRVLLMGMDLRAPKVTEYLGVPKRKGITNYITDEDIHLEDLIFNISEIKGLDIIASGVIPPNPAELLMTKRVDNLFTIVKQEYDIVVVDTAPVNLVTDTLLIGKYADMFMYVVRANYLDKRLLAVPQELYNEKKLPNMAIVLNDTDPKRSYGYGYGGYGYGYVVVEKPWYKKIFSRNS